MMPGRYNPHRAGYKPDYSVIAVIVIYVLCLALLCELLYDGILELRSLLR